MSHDERLGSWILHGRSSPEKYLASGCDPIVGYSRPSKLPTVPASHCSYYHTRVLGSDLLYARFLFLRISVREYEPEICILFRFDCWLWYSLAIELNRWATEPRWTSRDLSCIRFFFPNASTYIAIDSNPRIHATESLAFTRYPIRS
jgi:hypothetical protein